MSERWTESTRALYALYHLAATDARTAMRRLRQFDSVFANDLHYTAFRPGVLIEAGSGLDDPDLIREGVESLSDLLATDNKQIASWRRELYYNLGNGYSALSARERNGDPDPDAPLLQSTKQAYQDAIAVKEGTRDSQLLAEILTNYGNALAACGRHYEALLEYDQALRTESTHSMALGNKGIELERYAILARNQSGLLLAEAYELCRSAAEEEDLDRRGLASARAIFSKHRDSLEPVYAAWRERLSAARARQRTNAKRSQEEDHHHRFAADNGLYLNLCVHEWPCSEQHTDSLFFRYVAPLEDPHVFDRLARYFNQAKEDYATARYLLAESLRSTPRRQRLSDWTRYADLLEYADYGLSAGLAKAGFTGAYNVLDKIAVFLKWELELPGSERDATFRRIWHRDRKTTTLRPEIKDKKDPNLHALYDIALDLRQPAFHRLSELRHAITHRHLVTHDWLLMVGENSTEEEHILFEDLVDNGIKMLRLAKAALIYLAAYLSQEHDRRVAATDGILGPLLIMWQDEMR